MHENTVTLRHVLEETPGGYQHTYEDWSDDDDQTALARLRSSGIIEDGKYLIIDAGMVYTGCFFPTYEVRTVTEPRVQVT